VHAVSNRTTRPATSVHVYSPPLSSMAYFEEEVGGSLRATRAEDLSQWESGQ
jgi:hypothetical protein